MVRFSCFSTPPVNRSKKSNAKRTEDHSIKFVTGTVKSIPLLDNYNSSCNIGEQCTSPHSERDFWRSDALHVKLPEDNQEMPEEVRIKKSRSLGSILKKEGGYYGDDTTEDSDIVRELPFDLSNGWGMNEARESSDNNTNSTENFLYENDEKIYEERNDLIKSIDAFGDPMYHDSLISLEDLKQPDRDWHVDIVEQADDAAADPGRPSGSIPTLARSFSVANLRVNITESRKSGIHMFRRSQSFSDLNNPIALEPRLKNVENSFESARTVEKNIIVSCSKHLAFNGVPCSGDTEEGGLVRGDSIKDHDGKCSSLKLPKDDNAACHFQYNANIADFLRKSDANDVEFSHYNQDKMTPQEVSMQRVENWISQIDIHGDIIVEEQGETSTNVSKEGPQNLAYVIPLKSDTRSRLAMEVAYNYIASLTSSSSSAQLANLGLVAVPILSPFVSLRVLNLSGNAIVHITPGSLPKGLHMLNLSKNNISTIEGLRDLTHLRVLDLNYNKIIRIGHGLSSCASTKELYLAGNKISVVEGLHRLLKLNTLDLRFNKISTSKGLGQLAANYASLQAINLEGNPAQKNVGDDQLKKFLLSLLPNLVYYNKHAIRMGSKEASSRADRAVASLSLKASHGPDLHQLASLREKPTAAVTPSRKPSKKRHVRLQLPPAAAVLTKLRSDAGSKSLGLSASNAMKRSKSVVEHGGLFKS